jgi:hypothetical protein
MRTLHHSLSNPTARRYCAVLLATVVITVVGTSGAGRKFYDDDPIAREPETQDASGVKGREIGLMYDLAPNLFGRPGDASTNVRARNINTIDEVPDSNWFTNRILARPVSLDEAARGPLEGSGPAEGPWTIIRDKAAGAAPGFRIRDANGTVWFVSFDARGYPEAATSAIVVANKLFWALGYWQVENFLTRVRPEEIRLDPEATIRTPAGVRRKWRRSDLDDVFRRSERSADGSYRAVAARAIAGRPVEGFYYFGTRSDDPNDVVPHEHRRELRALKVFGAWTNLVDMKASNTVDSVVTENGRSVVRHYLQDVGSTFGAGANGPHDFFEGSEYLFEGNAALKRLVSLGFLVPPWQTTASEYHPAIGPFAGEDFDPVAWKPRAPTAAFLRARPDDTFWAARRVMAFSDELIRAMVATGEYSDPAAARYLADGLMKRRDAIGRAYLPAVNPIVDPALDSSGRLTFKNAAVDAIDLAPPRGYRAVWSTFDNATGATAEIGNTESSGTSITAPRLPEVSFVKVDLSATGSTVKAWETPISVYFRRQSGGWFLVGLERLPDSR